MSLEDVCEQFFITLTQQDHMVGNIRILFICTKVPNEETHGVFALINLSVGPNFTMLWSNQFLIRPSGISIRHNNICRNKFTIGQGDALSFTVDHFDTLDLRVQANLHSSACQ